MHLYDINGGHTDEYNNKLLAFSPDAQPNLHQANILALINIALKLLQLVPAASTAFTAVFMSKLAASNAQLHLL